MTTLQTLLKTGREHARWLGQAALGFVYPLRCLVCDKDIPETGSPAGPPTSQFNQKGFCELCLTKVIPSNDNACLRCGSPLGPFTNPDVKCLICARERYAFDGVIRLGVYRDEMRDACLAVKNAGGMLLGQELTDLLYFFKRNELDAIGLSSVVPVPEHWAKRIVRPQYAAETIAQQLSTRLKRPLRTDILLKVKWTPKQAMGSPTERREQQKGAFAIAKGTRLDGQTILLTDDILTTGATATEAARVLKQAGAKHVYVAVLAVSPP